MTDFNTGVQQIYDEAVACFGEDRVDINIHSHLYLYIHFPEITIRNKKKLSHTIKDLYVRLDFDSNLKFLYLKGTRTTVTKEEINNGYQHSHLDTDRTLGRFQSFCTGSSIITNMKEKLCRELDIPTLSALFFSLEEMMSWESLEGTPYIFIRDISTQSSLRSLSLSDSKFNIIYNKLLKLPLELDYNLYVQPSELSIDLFKEQIEPYLLLVIEEINDKSLFVEKSGNTYFNISSEGEDYSEYLGVTSWRFKGEFLPLNIKPNFKTIENKTYYPHPELTNKIYEKIKKEFQEFLSRKLTA